MENITCEKCGADLNNKKVVWLWYNRDNNTYSYTSETDEQFPFGLDCAKKLSQIKYEKN